MEMRELGQAGQADLPDAVAGPQTVAGPHRDAALRHVAVLGLPAVAVIDHGAVAAFDVLDRILARRRDRDVRHAVADAQHRAGGRGQYVDARLLGGHRRDPEIRPVMALIGQSAAPVVPRGGRRVLVDVMLDEAGLADLAGEPAAGSEMSWAAAAFAPRSKKGQRPRENALIVLSQH